MASGAASSSEPSYPSDRLDAGWKDEFWLAVVGSVDAWLRSFYGIREFADDPDCVLRLGYAPAPLLVSLSDGTEIREGELIGALHLWNEHMPRYSDHGPDFAWAKAMRRRMLRSLNLLAAFVEREPEWRPIRAFCGVSTLSSRLGDAQMHRLALRHGFEPIEPPSSLSSHLHMVADSVIVWGLTRAFNPGALPRQRFLRDYNQLWISRSMLLKLYDRRTEIAGATKPRRAF